MDIKDKDITNVMLEIPHGFTVGDKHFCMYQPSLGLTYINSQLLAELNINNTMLAKNAVIEMLRIVNVNRELCCKYIAYNTLRKKSQILDFKFVEERTKFFNDNLNSEDIALLMIQAMNTISVQDIINHTGIAEEKQQMQRIQAAKKNSNTYVFGGKTVYGAIIGTAMEKYHWTFDYTVWGISYANLQLLMADAITSIYLTDDERKSACIAPANSKKIKVTAANLAELKKQFQ